MMNGEDVEVVRTAFTSKLLGGADALRAERVSELLRRMCLERLPWRALRRAEVVPSCGPTLIDSSRE
jgi:hypothetical protein